MDKIFKCIVCKEYTLKKIHCDKDTISIKPVKYSVEDKYGKYRRIAKNELEIQG